MKTTYSFDDTAKDCLKNIAGYYGTYPISGTDAINVNCMGFHADVDTVIAALSNDSHDLLAALEYDGVTIVAGGDIFFGVVVTQITLTSGSGQAYRSEAPTFAAIPHLIGNPATAINGATIELNFSELMADPAAEAEHFVVEVDGSPATLTSVAHGTPDTQLIITMDSAITNGEVVTITMQHKHIKSAAGAYYLPGVDHLPVKNIVPA
jgi:uncharacterized repeat protein (TIGR02059 family)